MTRRSLARLAVLASAAIMLVALGAVIGYFIVHQGARPPGWLAVVASAAILAHSLVDFPLRTAAISAAFGMCLALVADRRPPQVADASDLRPTRHFVLR